MLCLRLCLRSVFRGTQWSRRALERCGDRRSGPPWLSKGLGAESNVCRGVSDERPRDRARRSVSVLNILSSTTSDKAAAFLKLVVVGTTRPEIPLTSSLLGLSP